jgi:hypothetical protein
LGTVQRVFRGILETTFIFLDIMGCVFDRISGVLHGIVELSEI